MNMFSVIPKKTAILVGVLAIILIILISLLFLNTQTNTQSTALPGQEPEETSDDPTIRTFPSFRSSTDQQNPTYQYRFNLPTGFSLPETIDNVKVSRKIDTTFLEQLTSRLTISTDPTILGSIYFWQTSDKTKALTVDTESGSIQYSNKPTTPTQTSINDNEQFERIAEQFLTNLNILDITPNTGRVTLFNQNHGDLVPTTNLEEANLIEVSYLQSFKGTPIYYHFATPATISVFLDKTGQIVGLRCFHIKPLEILNTTLINVEDMKQRVEKGDATIVNSGENLPPLSQQGTVTINNATLIYFDDKKADIFYPVILLEGVLAPSNRQVKLYFSVLSN